MQEQPRPAGTDVLAEALELVSNQRQATYGHPIDDYGKVVEIVASLTGIKMTVEQALLFMVSVKLARLRTNLERGILHRDSLVDAMGYLTCINMVWEARNVVPQ